MGYPPFSGLAFSPDVGVDYYLWSLQISGVGTLLTGVNFVTTILKLRAPSMTYFRMPVFCWTALVTNMMIIAAFPILTATFMMLLLDRYLGMHFFTNDAGGNQMMYVNLFWAWGHPEVYILVLPAFGIFSEVAATFSGKGLFSYRSMVLATLGICVLSFMVWLHHFFTMGAGADVNAFFGIMSAIIGVPTGVKVFNWLFTMFRGRIVFRTPMFAGRYQRCTKAQLRPCGHGSPLIKAPPNSNHAASAETWTPPRDVPSRQGSRLHPEARQVKPIDIFSAQRREIDEKIVTDLEKALARDGGFFHPILVRDEGATGYRLISGLHRVEPGSAAAARIGRSRPSSIRRHARRADCHPRDRGKPAAQGADCGRAPG